MTKGTNSGLQNTTKKTKEFH